MAATRRTRSDAANAKMGGRSRTARTPTRGLEGNAIEPGVIDPGAIEESAFEPSARARALLAGVKRAEADLRLGGGAFPVDAPAPYFEAMQEWLAFPRPQPLAQFGVCMSHLTANECARPSPFRSSRADERRCENLLAAARWRKPHRRSLSACALPNTVADCRARRAADRGAHHYKRGPYRRRSYRD